jgi:trimeric autotransporter adhesin
MSIYKSNENVNGVYVGSQRYIQIRLGSDLYWEAEKSYSDISLSASYSTTAVAASGGSLSPTISNLSQSWGWYSDTSGGGLISSIPVSYSFTGTVPSGWSINSSTGAVTIPSRGTTTGNALSATVRVTASANGKSTYKDCTVSQAANSITNSNYNPSYSNYTVTAGTITDNITAGGGSASWTEGTCTRTRTYYYLYSSGSTTQHSTVESGTTTSSATGSSTRFTINNTNRTASHSSMYGNNVTDTLTVTWYNCWDSSVSTSDTASVYNGYTRSTEYYSYTVVAGTITNNLTAAGGSISWTAGSAYHYSRNKYTNDSGYIEYGSGTKVTDSVTSSASGNSRFSISNSNRTATHSSMGTNSTTDTITVTWKNSSDTSVTTSDSASITNSYTTSTETYGYAVTAGSITNNLTAAGGSASWSAGSAYHYKRTIYTYDSGSTSSSSATTVTDSVTSSASGNSRFTIDNTNRSATHSSMGTTETTDTLTVTWANASDTSVSATDSVSVTNNIVNIAYDYDYDFWTVDAIPASGGTVSEGFSDIGDVFILCTFTSGDSGTWQLSTSEIGISYSSAVSASSLGTTIKDRTIVGYLTTTFTYNGLSCSYEAAVYQNANKIESAGELSFTISHSTLTAGADGGSYWTTAASQTVTYTSGSTGNYTGFTFTLDSSSPSWVSLSGSSTDSRWLSVAENLSTSTRTGTASVTVTGYGGASKTVTCAVTQYGYEISVSPTSVSPISASGGTTSLSVYSDDQGWSVSSSPSWITLSPTSGSEGTTSVTATVAANTGIARSGTVTFSGTKVGTASCKIGQVSGATTSLSASATTLRFDSTSSSESVTITATNQTWTASGSATWITLSPTKGSSGSSTLKITVSALSDGRRTGTVTITGSVSGTVTIKVTQFALVALDAYISLTPSTLSLASTSSSTAAYATLSDGTALSSSNEVNYFVTANEWLLVTLVYADNRAAFKFHASANNTGSSRSASVTVSKAGYLSATFTVTQSG